MPVRPLVNVPNTDSHKAALFARKPVGIKKLSPTPGSKTQKRKANFDRHTSTTKQFK